MRSLRLPTLRTRVPAALATALVILSASVARAQYTAVWYDGYAVSANSSDVDYQYTTRQGGVLGAINYAQNPAPADPLAWHHQVGNPGFPNRLLLASDGATTAMVSPSTNFKSLVGGGTPARVFFQLQLNADGGSLYTSAGFSLGSSSPLTGTQDATNHFGIRFVRDMLFGAGGVIQFFDGATQVGPNYSFPGGIDPGAGSFDVALNIADASDGNPWNGVGSTDIGVYVNGSLVGSYSKGGGGYTDNFMTLESGFGANGTPGAPVIGLAINVFNELTVFMASPVVWADSFSVSADSLDVNSEYTNGIRQAGILSPISYAQSPAGADYHHQVTVGNAPLLLAGDLVATGLVSPNYNFTNVVGGGAIDSVTFTMKLNDLGIASYAWASFSLGGSSQDIEADAATPHFGIRFIRDTIFGGGSVMQFYDGNTWIGGINYPFPNGIDPGAGYFNVFLSITNSTGGNPWVGVGTSTIKVYVNGDLVTSYSKVGGYTNNYLTLQGGWGASDATHIVLNRTIVGTFKVGVPPAEPTGLTVSPPDCGAIILNWTASLGVGGYNVKRSTTSGLETLLGTTSGTTFRDVSALPGTNYLYVVSATNNAGESASSTEVSAAWTSATSSNALLLTFDFGAPLGKATISGTNITLTLVGTNVLSVTNLMPTYTMASACAMGVPESGSSHDFTTPQTYIVTAADGSTKVYTVTVSINVPPANSYRILPIGDSITVGYMANTWTTLYPYGCGCRGPLFNLLADFGMPVQYVGNSPQPGAGTFVPNGLDLRVIGQDHHEAYGGMGTDFVLTNINGWIATNTPDIVLLMIGINDIGPGGTGEPTAAENNLSNIVKQIVSQAPKTHVIVAQITPFSTYSDAIVKYNDYIRNTLVPTFVANGKHVTAVNQYTNLLVAGTTNIDTALFSNGINHPNATGYSRMAQTWFQGIQALGLAVPPVPLPATGCTANSAVLNAALACPGTNYDVYAYWNTVKGGTSAALWTNSAFVGSWTNVASTDLSYTAMSLAPGTTYYFTFRATNAVSDLWAASVLSFTTLAAPPSITSVTLAGSNLVLNGQNGLAGLTYTTLLSTNLTKPLSQWTPVATNVLAASGNFTIIATNAVNPGAAQQFFLLKTP